MRIKIISILTAIVLATVSLCSCNNEKISDDNKSIAADKSYITANNPLIWSDVPDPDVIRVDDTYYMVSTTMYFTPGVPIMKSSDLVNWELVGYVYDILEKSPQTELFGDSNSYSQGSWAASIRYHDGMFYVLFCAWDQGKSYIFKTNDIESSDWERIEFDQVFHDASLFFDDDGWLQAWLVPFGAGFLYCKDVSITSLCVYTFA